MGQPTSLESKKIPVTIGTGGTKSDGWLLLPGDSKEPLPEVSSDRLVTKIRDYGRGSGKGGSNSKPSLPGTIKLFPPVRMHTRFVVVSAITTSTALTIQTLLASAGGICYTVNSKHISWFDNIKLRSITVWPTCSSTGTPGAGLSWVLPSLAFGNPDILTDQSLPQGVTTTSKLVFKPRKGSLASMWLSAAAPSQQVCFIEQMLVGSIVEVEAEYTFANQGSGVVTTITTGVLSQQYWLPLDGVTSNKIAAVGVPTTA